jgi:NADPH-dependent ferric siderophore reductase
LVADFLEKLRGSESSGLRVIATRRITPHMLRITFAGANLDRFATDTNLHVRLLLPPPGASRDRWLEIDRHGTARPHDNRISPIFRKYTIRRIDPAVGRVEIDFVLHDDGGPGAAWAAAAGPGDVIGMIGPGGRGIGKADWYLIAGDESALPAIGRILELLSKDARGVVIVEVADAGEQQDLCVPPNMMLRWLYRDGAAPGTTTLLLDAVAGLDPPADGGDVFVWAAAEFDTARAIRNHLKRICKLDKNRQLVVAYWRRGATGEAA